MRYAIAITLAVVVIWWLVMTWLLYGGLVFRLLWDIGKHAHEAGRKGWLPVVLFWLIAPAFGPRMVYRADMYAIRWATRMAVVAGGIAGLQAGCGDPACETCNAGLKRAERAAAAPFN